MSRQYPDEEKIKKLVTDLKSLVIKERKLKKNWRNEWLSSNQISRLREIYETHGYQAALTFQAGNINPRDNRFKQLEDETLLEALKKIHGAGINKEMSSYILGNLNNLIDMND